MEEGNLLDSIVDLLKMQERWMIVDDEGNLHELTDGMKGVPVLVTAKDEIYKLYFGKVRVSANDLVKLDEMHSQLMNFIWNNFSHKVRYESQEELNDIVEKYGLKKINKRAKK